MLVTFVSQCEKKALKRTRRILDAFANRIGDNVWQTAITEDGLQAVKKLLNASASKSTAVSCHLVCSRKRTKLVWVVGRKEAFNELGYVPVNWTTKELPMDLPIKTHHILANSQGQVLSQHLFAVGFLAYELINRLDIKNPNLTQSAFIAGVLHDIGKVDPQFQHWVTKKQTSTLTTSKSPVLLDDGVHIDGTVRGLAKFSFEKHPRHHELSWLFSCSLLKNNETLNEAQIQQIYHAIYWHHTRPYRKDNTYFDKAEGIDKLFQKTLTKNINEVFDEIIAILNDVSIIAQNFKASNPIFDTIIPKWCKKYQPTNNELPKYKQYNNLSDEIKEFVDDIRPNALHSLVRMAVISADRIVSKMTSEELLGYLSDSSLANTLNDIVQNDSELVSEINQLLQNFDIKYPNSERNQSQREAADKLIQIYNNAVFEERDNVSVLQGPAGCGKTKIALEWAAKTGAKQVVWVCPRVQVCLGLLHDLTQSDYLSNSRIEIFTGEHKKIIAGGQSFDEMDDTAPADYFSGDVIITTIDQVINNIISHQKITAMAGFMQAHVIFDEFHELITMPAFNLLFAELVEAKKMRKHLANTLLVSATPHDYFVVNVLGINKDDIVRVPSFNQSEYQIAFVSYDDSESNPLIAKTIDDDKTTFIITNTAFDAQMGFLYHQNQENAILLHSKYTKQDKTKWFNEVFASFKQHGSKRYQILRSGPIVQASLNVSCECMFTDLTSAENWLQRLGRLDRFGENKEVNVYTTVLPKSAEAGKQTTAKTRFLAKMNVWHSTIAWLNFIKNNLPEHKTTVKISELYDIYQSFYQDIKCQEKIEGDLIRLLRDSVTLINNKVIDPIAVSSHKSNQDGIVKIASVSLRGDSRFVQMAVCKIDSKLGVHYLNEYAYPDDTDHSLTVIGLTEDADKVQGGNSKQRDSNKDLLTFMHKKHHNIMKHKYPNETFKKSRFDWQLLQLARSPEFPIYLSYTPKDLEPIGGESERHEYSIYYVKTDKQPVGAMSLDKIICPQLVPSGQDDEAT